MSAQNGEKPTQPSSPDSSSHLAGFPVLRGSQALPGSKFFPFPPSTFLIFYYFLTYMVQLIRVLHKDYVENVITVPLKWPTKYLPQTPAQTGCPVYT
jgi:hypothetical protein